MTTISVPREWCSTGTKTDPGAGAALTGFVSGNPVASAHVNFLLNDLTVKVGLVATERLTDKRILRLRTLQRSGSTIDDTGKSMAAIAMGKFLLALKVNTAGIFLVSDNDRYGLLGAMVGITSLITDVSATSDFSRLVAIGTGGNKAAFSTDGGVTWNGSAGALGVSGARTRIVYDNVNLLWIAAGPSTGANKAYRSSTGNSWSVSTSNLGGIAGLAPLSGGIVLGLFDGSNGITKTADGGDNWSTAGMGFPSAVGLDETGCIAGNGTNLVYHVGRHSSGANLQISSSPNGVTWTLLQTITAASGGLTSFSARPRILVCPVTGLLVVVCKANSSTMMSMYGSVDGGTTWAGPEILSPGADYDVDGFAIAGGRLFCTTDVQLFASDGM